MAATFQSAVQITGSLKSMVRDDLVALGGGFDLPCRSLAP